MIRRYVSVRSGLVALSLVALAAGPALTALAQSPWTTCAPVTTSAPMTTYIGKSQSSVNWLTST